MTAIDLCSLWTALAADPANPTIRARARTHRDELFEHVDDCPACLAATRSSPNQIQLLEALADDDTGHAYDAKRENGWRQDIKDERVEIEAAVREILMPQLSRDAMLKFADVLTATESDKLSGLDLFRGSDAAALAIRSYPARGQRMLLHMDEEGTIFANGKLAIPPSSMSGEIFIEN